MQLDTIYVGKVEKNNTIGLLKNEWNLHTVSALVQCANSIFQNDFLGRTQFKFSTNLRTLFEKIAQKLDF